MKKTQESKDIEVRYPEIKSFDINAFIKSLFRFTNIKVEQALIKRVDYEDLKLKKLLGKECWDMHLNYSVGLVKQFEPSGESERGVWWYYGYLSKEFSAWEVDMNGDSVMEIMFVQHFDNYDYYNIIDKSLCKDFSYIPYSEDCASDSYPDLYFFHETLDPKKTINPFCTLEQKVTGRVQQHAQTKKNDSVHVIKLDKKNYLLNITEVGKEIYINVEGTQKLEFIGGYTYFLKK